jgi:cell fate (sporulation/competence/biofilm development) regulator YlbF (YheA/YmcA/DUF963 family)
MKNILKERESPLMGKIREMCQAILDQPAYRASRNAIDAFLADAGAREQYMRLCDQQEMMHEKQHHGMPISDGELEAFTREEDAFLKNPLAQEFIDAQRRMQEVEVTVSDYVRKTFELNRVPEPDDFEQGCGPSCGCGTSCG